MYDCLTEGLHLHLRRSVPQAPLNGGSTSSPLLGKARGRGRVPLATTRLSGQLLR